MISKLMQDFLDCEVVGDKGVYLMTLARQHKSNSLEVRNFTGDAYNVEFKNNTAYVENLWDENLPIEEFNIDKFIDLISTRI